MAFASPQPASAKKKAKTPDKELVIKVNTSKGYVTLGKLGLYNESSLHLQVSKLQPEQLQQLLAKATVEIIDYSRSEDDKIQLVI